MKKKKFWKKALSWLIIIIFLLVLSVIALRIIAEKTEEKPEIKERAETPKTEEAKETQPEYSFNVPMLLGKNAFEIKEILESEYGEPVSFWEPAEAMFGPAPGAMSWLDEKAGIILSFEYWQDGTINNNILFLGGAKEEGHTIESVLRAGSLKQGEQNYRIEINPLNIDEMIDIWIIGQ